MPHMLAIHKTQGFHQDSILEFSEESFNDFFLTTDKHGESVRYLRIDPANNVAGNIQSAEIPGALFFHPNKKDHPNVLLAVHHGDGRAPDLSPPEQVLISVILLEAKPLGNLMCPGCGFTEYFKAEIFGKGTVNEYGVLQDVDKDDCAIDEYTKQYFCTQCGFNGTHGDFKFADFHEIALSGI